VISARLGERIDPAIWAQMTAKQKAVENKKQRRLSSEQKREIAVMSNNEIGQERKRQASEFKHGALSTKYKRQRKRRMK
jgi:hypothetical protein